MESAEENGMRGKAHRNERKGTKSNREHRDDKRGTKDDKGGG